MTILETNTVSWPTIALIIIAIFQALQTLLMMMGTFILRDLRDRVVRLEDIELHAAKDARDRPLSGGSS
jgi:hypothetical protein